MIQSNPYPVENVTIEVYQTGAADWTVTYQLDRPVDNLYFEQQSNHFRAKYWTPSNSDWIIEDVNGKETVHRKDGRAFNDITLRFGPDYPYKSGSFTFSLPFTDGSFAIYTTHLLIHGNNPKVNFQFHPQSGNSIVLGGQKCAEPCNWTSPNTANRYGEFVYFGKITPEIQAEATLLVDPGLPPWLREQVNTRIPQILSYLNTKAGENPRHLKPYIIISKWPKPRELHRFLGEAGDHWIHLDLQGVDWNSDSREGREKFFNFLTHEISHLWTAQERPDFEKINWMNEGGAEAFTYILALRLGVIQRADYLHRIKELGKSCEYHLKLNPTLSLVNATTNDPTVVYSCGTLVNLTLDLLLTKASDSQDLFSFWKNLLIDANQHNGKYSEVEYFGLARKSAPWAQLLLLENMVTAPNVNPEDEIRNIMKLFN